MNFVSWIEAKRDGQPLAPAQVRELVSAYTRREIPDYQMSAWLMAVYFRGLVDTETRELTLAMRDSGERLTWPEDPRPVVDKHSTGGVGDKVSLPLAPLLACLGFRVPMISGRGLGITGGTLDKLESIPGFRTGLPVPRLIRIVQETGCAICAQSENMVPADKALYALRDVTGTVPSIPLIVASILSKKLAEGISALVLDVKFGAGAFMPTPGKARELAQAMVKLGQECGVRTRALLTNMDSPLGRTAGNWLEVAEAAECLSGGPTAPTDLRELVLACAAGLLVQTGKSATPAEALAKATQCLDSGEPLRKWREMLAAQGADLDAYERKLMRQSAAPAVLEVKAAASGFVAGCNARVMGEVVRDLGGGRLTRESIIDPDVGISGMLKPGESVSRGQTMAIVHARTDSEARAAAERIRSAMAIAEAPPASQPLLHSLI